MRVEATESTLYAAIDKAEALLIRGLRDKKERRAKGGVHTHHRMPASINDLLPEQPLELDANRAPSLPQEPLVVRRKVFHVPPMSVEQAVEEMESVGHPARGGALGGRVAGAGLLRCARCVPPAHLPSLSLLSFMFLRMR